MSNFGKILVFLVLFLILVVLFKYLPSSNKNKKEGFTQDDQFLFKSDLPSVYDDFYANIYDYLVFNSVKNNYEVGQIINSTSPNTSSVILDVGCGTGHHVNELSAKDLSVIGIDISPSMIQKARENYPSLKFQQGDVMNSHEFKNNTFTHILCLYFTIYYIKDKQQFFYNCYDWLMPGGYLIVHLVDREKFDPILPPGNPLYVVSPQKYAKERITKTKINFDEFTYYSNFDYQPQQDKAIFNEKFKFQDGKVRKQEHVLYMENQDTILQHAQDAGFLIHGKIDLVHCAYEHQYLYILMKPS